MTEASRGRIAILALILGAGLAVAGLVAGQNNTNGTALVAGGFSMITAIMGYAFGDKNGERRLANALHVLKAEEIQPGSTSPPE